MVTKTPRAQETVTTDVLGNANWEPLNSSEIPPGPPLPSGLPLSQRGHQMRIYIYELPPWLNLVLEMDYYSGHERFDSIYSAYNIFYERLLQVLAPAARSRRTWQDLQHGG